MKQIISKVFLESERKLSSLLSQVYCSKSVIFLVTVSFHVKAESYRNTGYSLEEDDGKYLDIPSDKYCQFLSVCKFNQQSKVVFFDFQLCFIFLT
jgi:hypothetical protein